ncbi:MAG: ATP-grasp domain-containing protein [Betaproteobacteria bacterium]|nr:ATP-grasp domain-containing protein [Betaproteobacteria bacterium]
MANVPLNVLVLAVGSPLGQSIVKALQTSRLQPCIYVADIDDLAAGFYLPGVHPVILPLVKDSAYFECLTAYIEKHDIRAIFPVIGFEHEFFTEHAEHFRSAGVEILTSAPSVYQLCNDKYKSMMHLRSMGLDAPDTTLCRDDEEVEQFLERNVFPVFVKPRSAASSVDIFKVRNRDQLFGILRAFPRDYFVAQAFLDDMRDFTAGVYISRDRSFYGTLLIERELKFGLSYRGTVFEDDALSDYCLKVAEAISSYYSINVQFKIIEGRPYAYEINPRLSSTTSVRAYFGFNEPDMILHELQGKLGGYIMTKRYGRFTRYWQEHYLEGL